MYVCVNSGHCKYSINIEIKFSFLYRIPFIECVRFVQRGADVLHMKTS
jgi:hypothetical protein